MNLLDGLTQYQTATIYYDWASKLEKDAENVLNRTYALTDLLN